MAEMNFKKSVLYMKK